MKLKSLFLATLAAMAMVSCSNENDPIENGDQAEKNALLQFRISYGSSVNTRADDTSGDQTNDEEAGLEKEQKFSKAWLIVAYQGGVQPVIVEELDRKNDFMPVEDPAGDGKYYQSTPINVETGKVKAYVVLNPGTLSTTTSFENKKTPDDVEAVLKGLKLTTLPAAENTFVMYGAAEPTTEDGFIELVNNETTTIPVTVERVTAKLKEETPKDKITATVKNGPDGALSNPDGTAVETEVSVTLTGYGFTNLTDKSNLVYQSDAKITTFTEASEFEGDADITSFNCDEPLGSPAKDAQITYCWENENAETVEDKGDNITSIIYKGKITITADEHTVDENVYVYNNKVYNYTELSDALPGLKETDGSSIADYDKRGILKYEKGVCYYRQPILTNNKERVIERNNVYKLKVNSISSIGYPTPIRPVEKTMMQLYITVNKWTVNINNFEL